MFGLPQRLLVCIRATFNCLVISQLIKECLRTGRTGQIVVRCYISPSVLQAAARVAPTQVRRVFSAPPAVIRLRG
jgi:hypothetical protein